MNNSNIKKMSIVERLQTMEAIWDSLLHDDIEIDSPMWHQSIIEERVNKIEEGTAIFYTLDELKSKHKK